jgi:hypothetical protein
VDGIVHVDFITFIFVIPAAPWHPEMKFVNSLMVVYWNVWVRASDHSLLKRHFPGHILKENRIPNTRSVHADQHGR